MIQKHFQWYGQDNIMNSKIIIMEKTAKLVCRICDKTFKHLGSHIWMKHKMTARDYKSKFSLPFKMGLVSEDIRIKQQDANERNWSKVKKNLTKSGIKYRFKKGRTGQRRISQYERKKIMIQIEDVNKAVLESFKPCPVCHIQYNNLASHLLQAHGLLQVRKEK